MMAAHELGHVLAGHEIGTVAAVHVEGSGVLLPPVQSRRDGGHRFLEELDTAALAAVIEVPQIGGDAAARIVAAAAIELHLNKLQISQQNAALPLCSDTPQPIKSCFCHHKPTLTQQIIRIQIRSWRNLHR